MPKKLTAKRKVFLEAVAILQQHARRKDMDTLATTDALRTLLGKAPHSGHMAAAWAICSAMYCIEAGMEPDDCDEMCHGASLFMVAFRLGRIDAITEAYTP